jgi:hypothetical protein
MKRSKEKCIVKCGDDAKISKVKRAIKKTTHVEMDGVSATEKMRTTKMVLTTTTLNVALTLERPWLGCLRGSNKIRTLASLLTLYFAYKLVDSFVFVDYGWHTHTLFVSSRSFSLFFGLGVSLFSFSWSTSKLCSARYKHTLSQFGVKCMMLRNSRKATLKG